MDDDEVVTEQIRQLTLTDRLKFTGDGDVPALDTRLPDGAAGESGYSKARAGTDDDDLQADVRDESLLMATDEHRSLGQAAERLNLTTGAQSPFDTTIAEVRQFTKRESDDSG